MTTATQLNEFDTELSADETAGPANLTKEKRLELEKQLKACESNLRRLAMRLMQNEFDADDVIQDAFLRAYKAYGNFRGDSQFYTWMYQIVRNVAYNHLSKKSKSQKIIVSLGDMAEHCDEQNDTDNASEWLESMASSEESPEALAEARQAHQKLMEALARLESEMPHIYVAFNDVVIEKRPYEDVAREAEVPVGTIRSRVFRARQHLAKVLREMEGDDDYEALIKPRLVL